MINSPFKNGSIKKLTGSSFNQRLIGDCLGTGGEGEVYKYGKTRAIKFIHQQVALDFGFSRSSFNKVMRYLKKHSRPEYSRVFTYGSFDLFYSDDDNGVYFFYTSERMLCHPATLTNKEYLNWERKLKKFPFRFAFDDLREDNIMINKNGEQKIVDLTTFCWYV